MIISLGIALFLAVISGVVIYRRCSDLERFERAIGASMPALAALLGIAVILTIRVEPYYDWNDARLARTFALFHGVPLYLGADATGPIVGTNHAPVSHFLYWPAIFAATPISAIQIASTISFVLAFGPVIWLHWPGRLVNSRSVLYSTFALITCGYILLRGDIGKDGITYCIFHVHTDAAAIFFATIAGGLICRTEDRPGWQRLLLSSLFAVLSLGCKQTMAPVLPALCLFLWIGDGFRTAVRYGVCLLGSGFLVFALLVYRFRPAKDLFFNILTLASHRPYDVPMGRAFVAAVRDKTLEGLPAIYCLVLFGLYWYFYERDSSLGWRKLFTTQRWLVFPVIGLLLAPVMIKARMTIGGDSNHIGTFCFFLSLGATLGLSRFMSDETSQPKAAAARSLAMAMIAVSLIGVIETVSYAIFKGNSGQSNVGMAYEYSLKHPGRAYFPRFPLAVFYAQHRFYHSDGALIDRELAGHPISHAQYASGIPSNFEVIALPAGYEESGALVEYLKGWTQLHDSELPGFGVYQRPSTASQISQ